MADTKISALTVATTPLAGTEVLPIVQSGVTKQVSIANLTAGRAVSAASLTLTTTPLGPTSGGTGLSSATTGDLLYASGTNTWASLADVATGNALISGGVGVAPSWGKIGLATHVSGTLGVGNGGTGLTSWTANGLLYDSGTTTLTNGSALTYDGTTLKTKNASSGAYLVLENSDPSIGGGEAIQLQFNYTTVAALSTNWNVISRYAGANFQFISDTNGAGGVVRFTLDAGTGNAIVETGNLVIGTSGKGVNFTANTPAAGMTSQLLNWYEEGTWTPTDQSGAGLSFTSSSGKYTRIGNMVYATGFVQYPATSNASQAIIGGLPWNSANSTSSGNATIGYKSASTLNSMQVVQSNNTIKLWSSAGAATTNAGVAATQIYFTAIYPVS